MEGRGLAEFKGKGDLSFNSDTMSRNWKLMLTYLLLPLIGIFFSSASVASLNFLA